MLGQLAVGIEYRHELLVRHHGGHQRFGRHAEELALEPAGNRHWPLGEVGQLVQQRIVELWYAAGHTRGPSDLVVDTLAPLAWIGQHVAGAHRIQPAVRIGQMHRLRVHEAMAARLAAAAQAQHAAVDDVGAVQDHQPVRRTHEAVVVVGPAHRPRDRQRLQRLLDDFRQQRRHRLPRLDRPPDEPATLVGFQSFQLLDADAAGLREAKQRLRRLACRIERRSQRRATAFQRLLRLRRGYRGNICSQAPGRGIGLGQVETGVDAAPGQAVADAAQESGGQFVQRLRRQLLGAQLDQQ